MFDPATVDIEKSRTTAAKVGCDGGSFVVAHLRNALKILPENIVTVYSEDPENSLTSSCKRLASEPDDDPGRRRRSCFLGLFGIAGGTATIYLLIFFIYCPQE